jgi:hypothetical protein
MPDFSIKIGTKAELNAPSANILLKKFGNLKAAKKTSDSTLTPINFAIKISLMKPKTLDEAIKKDMVKYDLRSIYLLIG